MEWRPRFSLCTVLPYDDDGPFVPGAVPHAQLPRAPPDDLGEVPVGLEVGGERVDLSPEEAEVAVHARLVPVQGLLKALGGALIKRFLKKIEKGFLKHISRTCIVRGIPATCSLRPLPLPRG